MLKNAHIQLNNKLKNDTAQYEADLDSYKTKCIDFESKVNLQADTIKKLKQQILKLQNELKYNEENKKDFESTISISTSDELNAINVKYQQAESQFTSTIENQQIKISNLEDEKEELEKRIASLENVNKVNNSRINSLLAEKQELVQENSNLLQSCTEKYENEKSSLKRSYENTLEELRKQNEKCRNDVEKLSKTLAGKEEQITELQKNVKVLSIAKNKAINEARTLNDQIGREKKLADATLKSQMCSIETKYKEKIEMLKTQSADEQHKMVLYVVDAFRTTFTGFIGKVEDRSFRSIIDKIREQYIKLLDSDASIRRMLNVQDRQTTQDAVAQLLINH